MLDQETAWEKIRYVRRKDHISSHTQKVESEKYENA